MSIQSLKKDIMELKRAAALENKQAEDYRIKNLTDEELQEELDRTLAEMGFKSKDELNEAARKYFAENGLRTTFYNDWDFQKYVCEYLEEIVMENQK